MKHSLLYRIMHTNDIAYKLFAASCFVIVGVITTNAVIDYRIRMHSEQALSFAQNYYRAVIEQREISQQDGTKFNPQQIDIGSPQPGSIERIELTTDLHTLTIHLSNDIGITGARLILSNTDGNPFRPPGCHSPDGIKKKHLPKMCRDQG